MILKFANQVPEFIGTPTELAEVIKILNGGVLHVTITPTSPASDVKTEITPQVPEPKVFPSGILPPHPTTHKRGRVPKIPHSEDEWILEQRADDVSYGRIATQLNKRGIKCSDGDVANRCYSLTHVSTTKTETAPNNANDTTDDMIRDMTTKNILPIEIAMTLSRKTKEPWSSDKVVERQKAIAMQISSSPSAQTP
jgi:hypothetical protein